MSQQTVPFAAFIGIDWADRKHDFCLQPAAGGTSERGVLEHRPAAITAWAVALRERFGGAPVAVAVEIALELLVRHRDKLAPLAPQSAPMRALQRLVQDRRLLVHDRVRITNRIVAALKAYFPQPVEWFRDKETELFAAFLERWPTLPSVQRAHTKTLVDFFHAHHVRYSTAVDKRIAAIRAEQPLTSDAAVIGPAKLLVQALLPQLRAVTEAIRRFDSEIERVAAELPDVDLFRALPGAGPVFSARLLAAFGEQRDRYPNAYALQCFAGVAPVTKRSGNKSAVTWRFACNTFLRQTFVEWAAGTVVHSFWAKAFYERARQRGTSRQATLRALAFKWIRILHRCWQDRRTYDESRYLEALKARQSPLLKFAAGA
jgi:transposase